MHIHMKKINLLILFFSCLNIYGQNLESNTFLLEDLFILIRSNHPIAQQIELLSDKAKAKLTFTKGQFDPKLYSDFSDKYFDEKNYWQTFKGGLKIATILPLEIKSDYSWNEGIFLNPGQTIPSQGQVRLGGNITLGQGLLIDQRRASLKQAKIFGQLAEKEQTRLLNNLFFEAAKTYWEWSQGYARIQVLEQATNNASQRFEAVKATFLAGDYAGIDTTEALVQLQTIQLRLNEARIKFQHSQFELSNFLWNDEGQALLISDELTPISLYETLIPKDLSQDSLQNLFRQIKTHPELQKLFFKQSELAVEERLKKEKLKPVIDLEYNLLSPNDAFVNELGVQNWPLNQNYKWGITVGFPLFLRKERGDLAMTRIKIEETRLQQQQKQLTISNKLQAYINEFSLLRDQVLLSGLSITNYERLLSGEETRFNLGESTLFLVNSRQMKLLEAQLKLIDLKGKLFKAESTILWVGGILAG